MATIAGVALLVFGALFTVFGLLFVIAGAAFAPAITELDPSLAELGAAAAGFVIALAAIILLIGILEIATSIGIFVHRSWARWTGIALGAIGTALGFFMIIIALEPPSDSGFATFAAIWLGAHGFTVAALAVGGEHFEPIYPGR